MQVIRIKCRHRHKDKFRSYASSEDRLLFTEEALLNFNRVAGRVFARAQGVMPKQNNIAHLIIDWYDAIAKGFWLKNREGNEQASAFN
ncbi:MAG: hypothetical protein A3I66_01925 [Burkholderiales bacterium RIFCSPLOWO2_02_FULL_57_36]|nr:MAG: hypothetical protein A3I66_01925 [Burkholderiales bacterium RIFCSPLOWO2_02_FULL_57_36]